jgi:HAD superfamily hydrolase (TIGR01509 family)
MSVRAVIFDWDGVLVDSVPAYFAAFKKVLAKHGAAFLPEYNNRFNGPTIQEIFQTVKDEQHLTFDVDQAVRERDELMDAALRDAPLFPGAKETINALAKQGIKVAIASGAPRKQIDLKLAREVLQMGVIVTAEDVARGKPDPQVYLRAAELLSIPPQDCLAVEDAPAGIEAAQRAGMHAIAITNTLDANKLRAADAIISRIDELQQHLGPRVAAIIQARLGSGRFPNKVLQPINGTPMLQFLINRLRRARTLHSRIIATTTETRDDQLVSFCAEHGWQVFRGSEDDVLDRYYQAAKAFRTDVIVRITADCPLIDPAIVDRLVEDFRTGGADYVCNIHPPTYPDGLDVEVFSFDALERAWKLSREKPNLALVTGHILKNPDQFSIRNVRNAEDLSAYRFTVDYPEDLELVSRLCALLGNDSFGLRDLMSALGKHPELRELNARFKRNEGMIADMKKYGAKP